MSNSEGDWDSEELERPVPVSDTAPEGKQVYIRVRDLHKHFGRRHVLRGIDLDVYHGETLVILGISGSGKTTFIKHLMGSARIESGDIRVGDFDLRTMRGDDWRAYRSRMGVVFQHAALLGSLTILRNVGLPLIEEERVPLDEVRERVIRALRRVFLPAEEILELKPASLSGGMRKRVGIARAIIREPDLLLYDEPTTGLDPVTVSGVNELMRDLQERLGVTSIVITHDLDAAFSVADRIAMLYKGRIIALDTPQRLRENDHPVLRQLLEAEVRGPLTEGYV
ncbi:MAG: ABC transporter ATP-binding protein [Planctomycetota bacterium]